MKLRILSDLHLEFKPNLKVPVLEDDKDTVLILAGDIGLASKEATYKEFVEDMSMQFKAVIYVMGNHEHYKGKFPTTKEKLLTAFADCPNVHVLEKDSVVIDHVAFIGATLWTSMDNMDALMMYQAQLGMNDYRVIRNGPRSEPWKSKLRPMDTVEDHVNAVHYIFAEIEKQLTACNHAVVVTHMGPSWKSVHEIYKGEPMNPAYVSNLDEHIMDAKPHLWIHGHTHVSFDYMLEDTRVVCNPAGYVGEENPDFDAAFTVELDNEVNKI